jgi:AraC-like DNA-binding protein
MDDFASAAMLRVLRAGLRALRIDAPGAADEPDPPAGAPRAQVPLDLKRALVEAAVRAGGLACLPRLGRGVHAHPDDPAHRALVAARDGLDLIERWRRLERYVHSRHRIEVVEAAVGRATLRHVSRDAGTPPSAPEDLVVLGVIAALLEAFGATGVVASIDDAQVLPGGDEATLRRLAAARRTGTWTLAWREPDAPVAPRADGGGAPVGLCDAMAWPGTAKRCARVLLADPLGPRSLAAVAASLGISGRSLQRALAADGLRFSDLLAEVRVRAAAWWLIETAEPIAAAGFVAGYSDQPHFTRDFGRRTGLPPGRYREHFARSAP